MLKLCLLSVRMNIFGLYLSKLDTNISDLQSQLEELKTKKNEEVQRLKSELENVHIKNEENEDMVKVKQR